MTLIERFEEWLFPDPRKADPYLKGFGPSWFFSLLRPYEGDFDERRREGIFAFIRDFRIRNPLVYIFYYKW